MTAALEEARAVVKRLNPALDPTPKDTRRDVKRNNFVVDLSVSAVESPKALKVNNNTVTKGNTSKLKTNQRRCRKISGQDENKELHSCTGAVTPLPLGLSVSCQAHG